MTVADELTYIDGLIGIAGRRVLDIGCGDGSFARRLVQQARAASVVGIERDPTARVTTQADGPIAGLRFERGVAEAVPLPDASIDVALMLKSLHHVPLQAMDRAFAEAHRVLADAGLLYVSEPVYAGEFNEVMRLFHDEGVVRAAAQDAIARAVDSGRWQRTHGAVIDMALHFRDFDDFVERMVVRAGMAIADDVLPRVQQRFERAMTTDGARFERQLRVDVLKKTQVAGSGPGAASSTPR